MQNLTPLFPGFHLQTLRRKPRSEQHKLADKIQQLKLKSFSQLSECIGKFIPDKHLQPPTTGEHSRQRIYSKKNTFWAFFSQILDADGGCQEVVRKLQAIAAMKQITLPSSSTSAYCQARHKLDLSSLNSILEHTSEKLQSMVNINNFYNRRVIVVDGTGVSMPDTEKNQQQWPQQKLQKPGCGFPQASICACFCLQTGGLLSYEMGNKKSHELPLLRKQSSTFKTGDIFLGDKGFCSFYDVHRFQSMGVDSVITLARRHPVSEMECVKVLGDDDLLVYWKRPVRSSYSQDNWDDLPEKFLLRQIKVTVDKPGFRVSTFHIITTLLDAEKYSANKIADLYFQRWNVELYFRDIKTSMGMDILRCKTPDMVRKEILMHFIAYNSIRCLMIEAAVKKSVDSQRISFKASLQALRQWEPHLNQTKINKQDRHRLMNLLYDSIAKNIVIDRPGRSEPRAVKRRPKPFQLLTAPRHEMKVVPHRGKSHAKQA
ncbi:MAG: IS4 family transposase [Gammaproteobacteria bacterium]|nr:IS4 family transposase [Gammaproteobacteria bacterium]